MFISKNLLDLMKCKIGRVMVEVTYKSDEIRKTRAQKSIALGSIKNFAVFSLTLTVVILVTFKMVSENVES